MSENQNSPKAKYCTGCGNEIHPKRVAILPNVTTCVNCSTTGPKRGVTVSLGDGDHNYNDLVIMEEDEFRQYNNLINASNDLDLDKKDSLELVDLDKDDSNFSLSNINNELDPSLSPTMEDEEFEEEIEEELKENNNNEELFTSEID
jgi:hypothetical protein